MLGWFIFIVYGKEMTILGYTHRSYYLVVSVYLSAIIFYNSAFPSTLHILLKQPTILTLI